jgi:hypothetical protein
MFVHGGPSSFRPDAPLATTPGRKSGGTPSRPHRMGDRDGSGKLDGPADSRGRPGWSAHGKRARGEIHTLGPSRVRRPARLGQEPRGATRKGTLGRGGCGVKSDGPTPREGRGGCRGEVASLVLSRPTRGLRSVPSRSPSRLVCAPSLGRLWPRPRGRHKGAGPVMPRRPRTREHPSACTPAPIGRPCAIRQERSAPRAREVTRY